MSTTTSTTSINVGDIVVLDTDRPGAEPARVVGIALHKGRMIASLQWDGVPGRATVHADRLLKAV